MGMENIDWYRNSFKLSGHAVVFGGSGGIGSEIVWALVAQGIDAISFTYENNKEKADQMIGLLEACGVKAYSSKVNLSDKLAVEAFQEAAVARVGIEITKFVHAVGKSPNKPFREQTLETTSDAYDDLGWRDIYEVNVFGPMVSCRSVLMRMEAMGITDGSGVIITSTNGGFGRENSADSISTGYDTSKAAQISLVPALAKEFAHVAHVNGLAPGWVDTPMNDTLPPEIRKSEIAKIWIGEFAHPRLIAAPIAFLLSPAASFIRGQNIVADGGYPK